MKKARVGSAGRNGNSGRRYNSRIAAPLATCPLACRDHHELRFAGTHITGTVCNLCGFEVETAYWTQHLHEIAEAIA